MVNNVLLFYFEVFGSYYQLYKLANNRDKLVNTFCVIHENRRANVVECAKGVYYGQQMALQSCQR